MVAFATWLRPKVPQVLLDPAAHRAPHMAEDSHRDTTCLRTIPYRLSLRSPAPCDTSPSSTSQCFVQVVVLFTEIGCSTPQCDRCRREFLLELLAHRFNAASHFVSKTCKPSVCRLVH